MNCGEKISSYQKGLLGILSVLTFFEGYDFIILGLMLPYITKDFEISTSGAGMIVSLAAIGSIVAFFVIRQADKFGRKPVFVLSVFLYSIFSGLTAFTQSIELFVFCQFMAKIFLATEFNMATLVIAEEFPARHRGLGIGIVQGASAAGGIAAAILLQVVTKIGYDWRLLYLLGSLPIIVAFVAMRYMRETYLWTGRQNVKTELFKIWAPQYRRDLIVVIVIWLCTYLSYTICQAFWSYFAVNERGWNQYQVGTAMAIGYTVGVLGFLVSGRCMDWIGRRGTAAIFFILGVVTTAWAFHAYGFWMYLSMIIMTFFVAAYLPISATFTTELFPTEIRATAMAWGNNLIGRVGQVVSPGLAGFLAAYVGSVGNSVTLIGTVPLISVVLIYLFVRETKAISMGPNQSA